MTNAPGNAPSPGNAPMPGNAPAPPAVPSSDTLRGPGTAVFLLLLLLAAAMGFGCWSLWG